MKQFHVRKWELISIVLSVYDRNWKKNRLYVCFAVCFSRVFFHIGKSANLLVNDFPLYYETHVL